MKSILVGAALALVVLIAPASYAQSSGEPAVDEVAADGSAVETPPSPSPIPMEGWVYLQTADSLPFGLWEVRVADTLRQYRLGVISQEGAYQQLQFAAGAASVVATQLRKYQPPPQMAHAHDLNINAATEYQAAFEAMMTYLSGDESAFAAADSHLLRAEDLAYQARQELR